MIKVAIVGLDTSHSVELPRLMQAPDCPPDRKVPGLRAVTCLRFDTPFQNKEGLDKRQKQLEDWGIKVTTDFDECVRGCDAIMLEINDPAYHLEYFRKVAGLGKPVFLDKPLAGTLADGRAILDLTRNQNTRVWSGSSVPFAPSVRKAVALFSEIRLAHVFGALGTAPAGDSMVWYGVHVFETLQRILGPDAKTVRAMDTGAAVVTSVDYGNGRQGLVEAVRNNWIYGGRIHGKSEGQEKVHPFICDGDYTHILREVEAFFQGKPAPVDMTTTFEGLALTVAAGEAVRTGRPVSVATP